jgi:hypothetical protein
VTDTPVFYDHYWAGAPTTLAKAIEGYEIVLGPVTVDDFAIACVRATEPLELPENLKERPQVGRAVLGVFAE